MTKRRRQSVLSHPPTSASLQYFLSASNTIAAAVMVEGTVAKLPLQNLEVVEGPPHRGRVKTPVQ